MTEPEPGRAWRPVRRAAAALGRAALDWVYPPGCAACGDDVASAHALCGVCWSTTRFISEPRCDGCGAPLPFDEPTRAGAPAIDRCPACADAPRGWDRARAAVLYEGAGRTLVLALKHRDRTEAARAMGAWMSAAALDLRRRDGERAPPLLLAAPLHWRRRVRRGFNQSEALAEQIEAASGGSFERAPPLLTRRRATPSQAGRGLSERIANMSGAFEPTAGAAARISGRRIVLVDDVMTTGATLAACGDALREAGAASVDVLVFARAVGDRLDSA